MLYKIQNDSIYFTLAIYQVYKVSELSGPDRAKRRASLLERVSKFPHSSTRI